MAPKASASAAKAAASSAKGTKKAKKDLLPWDEAHEKILLVTILEVIHPGDFIKEQWTQIAEKMAEKTGNDAFKGKGSNVQQKYNKGIKANPVFKQTKTVFGKPGKDDKEGGDGSEAVKSDGEEDTEDGKDGKAGKAGGKKRKVDTPVDNGEGDIFN